MLTLLFAHDWAPQAIGTEFEPQILLAIGGMAMALLMLVAVAIAASTRLGQLPTLAITMGLFLVGLLSDWLVRSGGSIAPVFISGAAVASAAAPAMALEATS